MLSLNLCWKNTAVGGQGVGNGQVLQNPLILDSSSIPQSNAEFIMASAVGGMFSIKAANQFVNLSAAQKKKFTACSIRKIIQDEALRKDHEEASYKQNQLTKEKPKEK